MNSLTIHGKMPQLDTYSANLIIRNKEVFFRWEGEFLNFLQVSEQVQLANTAVAFARQYDREKLPSLVEELSFWMGARSAVYIRQEKIALSLAG